MSAPGSPTAALDLRDVFKIYQEGGVETVALRGAWLSVAPGEFVAVMGPSGSGKSTLLTVAAGLTSPTAGQVLLNGQAKSSLTERERSGIRRRELGIVFQRDNLVPFLDAVENVELVMADRRDRRHAAGLLERVGVGHRLHHRVGQLSGGEQQRVAIAVGLANEPRLLLADEPTGELDSATAEMVVRLLVSLSRERGVAVLLVTHNLDLAERADRIVRMRDGLLTPFEPSAADDRGAPARSPGAATARRAGQTAVSAVDLIRTYPGGVRALDGVSLEVRAGESVAVVGPSGCGKSTLLNLLGGLDRPTAGSVVVGGHVLSGLGGDDLALLRRRELGFVFQAHNLLATLNAAENVALPLILDGIAEEEWRSRAGELLGAVGVADAADKLPDQLSGGQRQRVAVARALAHRPRLLLADEPTGSLDSASAAQIAALLADLAVRQDIAVVLVTHDPAVAAHCDRTLRLADGRRVEPVEAPGAAECVLSGVEGG